MVHSAMLMIARLPSASAWDWLDSFRMGRGLLADLPIANVSQSRKIQLYDSDLSWHATFGHMTIPRCSLIAWESASQDPASKVSRTYP